MTEIPRNTILARVRAAASLHERAPLPAPLVPATPSGEDPALVFQRRFVEVGGEVVLLKDRRSAMAWCESWYGGFRTAAVSAALDPALAPVLERAAPSVADLGVSVAVAAAADTGSLLLGSSEGRRLQLLPPVHLVWVRRDLVRATLVEALAMVRELPGAAIGVHSGPSKSADIGGVLVRGVHGPGRIVAAILG